MNRAVKYCGGCHPGYDRIALVKDIEDRLGEKLSCCSSETEYDELYVICGCSARCADISACRAGRIIYKDTYNTEV